MGQKKFTKKKIKKESLLGHEQNKKVQVRRLEPVKRKSSVILAWSESLAVSPQRNSKEYFLLIFSFFPIPVKVGMTKIVRHVKEAPLHEVQEKERRET